MLNKNGWGFTEMLVLMGILALFLFIAIYFIYRAYNDYDTNINNKYYQKLENKLEEQATIYLDNYYDEVLTNDSIIITKDILQVYNLDVTLNDSNGQACDGYVKANKSKGIRNIKGYIKCPHYETNNY